MGRRTTLTLPIRQEKDANRGVNGTRAYLFHFVFFSTMETGDGKKRKRGKFAQISSQLFASLSSSTHTRARLLAYKWTRVVIDFEV